MLECSNFSEINDKQTTLRLGETIFLYKAKRNTFNFINTFYIKVQDINVQN